MSKSYRLLFPLLALLLVAALLPGEHSVQAAEPNPTLGATPVPVQSVAPVFLPFLRGKANFLGDEYISCTYIDETGATDIYVQGDYAYCASGWGGITIFDVSDSELPVQISSARSFADPVGLAFQSGNVKIDVSDGFAYRSCGNLGLVIFDVRDPYDPKVASVWTQTGFARDVQVVGDYAYVVADSYHGLCILDVSDPTAPRWISSPLAGYNLYSTRVFVYEGYAYLASYVGWLVIDVNDPYNPNPLGYWAPLQSCNVLYACDGYCYFADGANLLVVSPASRGEPAIIAGIELDYEPVDLFAKNGYLYASNGNWIITVIDIHMPERPYIETEFELYMCGPNNIFIEEEYMYLAEGSGFKIFR